MNYLPLVIVFCFVGNESFVKVNSPFSLTINTDCKYSILKYI